MNVRDLLEYATQHPSYISMDRNEHLIKLNYTKKTMYEGAWNEFTRVSRGIIINAKTHEILAHPFNKFYNDFEYARMGIALPDLPYWVLEKLDGVLIIPYMFNNELCFSTRGRFKDDPRYESNFIQQARDIATFDTLPLNEYSFMFEMISPEFSKGDFLVTKYDKEELVLIGVRDMQTYKLLSPPEVIELAKSLHLSHYSIISMTTIQELQREKEALKGSSLEGWVVFYENSFLVKIKRIEYLNIFRTVQNLNHKTVLKQLMSGNFDLYLQAAPEELQPTILTMHETIKTARDAKIATVRAIFNQIPAEIRDDRKQYFIYIHEKHPDLVRYLSRQYLDSQDAALHELYYKEALQYNYFNQGK